MFERRNVYERGNRRKPDNVTNNGNTVFLNYVASKLASGTSIHTDNDNCTMTTFKLFGVDFLNQTNPFYTQASYVWLLHS